MVISTHSILLSMSEDIEECITTNFHEIMVDPLLAVKTFNIDIFYVVHYFETYYFFYVCPSNYCILYIIHKDFRDSQ